MLKQLFFIAIFYHFMTLTMGQIGPPQPIPSCLPDKKTLQCKGSSNCIGNDWELRYFQDEVDKLDDDTGYNGDGYIAQVGAGSGNIYGKFRLFLQCNDKPVKGSLIKKRFGILKDNCAKQACGSVGLGDDASSSTGGLLTSNYVYTG